VEFRYCVGVEVGGDPEPTRGAPVLPNENVSVGVAEAEATEPPALPDAPAELLSKLEFENPVVTGALEEIIMVEKIIDEVLDAPPLLPPLLLLNEEELVEEEVTL